jgi:hypothetical protein
MHRIFAICTFILHVLPYYCVSVAQHKSSFRVRHSIVASVLAYSAAGPCDSQAVFFIAMFKMVMGTITIHLLSSLWICVLSIFFY